MEQIQIILNLQKYCFFLFFCIFSVGDVQYFVMDGVIGAMKRLSHIMVSLSVLLLLVFGSGGMGCQRCSCSGRVSILFLDDSGCCSSGSGCMDVKVSPVSPADIVQ